MAINDWQLSLKICSFLTPFLSGGGSWELTPLPSNIPGCSEQMFLVSPSSRKRAPSERETEREREHAVTRVHPSTVARRRWLIAHDGWAQFFGDLLSSNTKQEFREKPWTLGCGFRLSQSTFYTWTNNTKHLWEPDQAQLERKTQLIIPVEAQNEQTLTLSCWLSTALGLHLVWLTLVIWFQQNRLMQSASQR